MNEQTFEGKICFVTGAASGIGLGMSRHLLGAGAVVYISDRDKPALERLEAEEPHKNARYSALDITDENAAQTAIQACAKAEGRLDYLFNNAGIVKFAPFMETTSAEWRRILDINVMGAVFCTRAAAPFMSAHGGGHIVNTASLASFLTQPFQSAYCASKFALLAMGEALRYELERFGICVSTVCPGDIATNLVKNSDAGDSPIDPEAFSSVDDIVEEIMSGVAAKRNVIIAPGGMRAKIHFDELFAAYGSDFLDGYYKKTAASRWQWHDENRR